MIHAWDERAFTVAMLAAANHVVCALPAGMGAGWLRQVNRAIGRRDVDVICANAAQCRAIITGGVPPRQCHPIRPPLNVTAINPASRPEIRERLGLRDGPRRSFSARADLP